MAERDKIFESKVVHSGIFDFKETYAFAYSWLIDEGYEVREKKYSEKVKVDGKEVEISWEVWRKISDYFKFYATVKWRILRMNSVEVEKNGVKVKLNKGQPEIKIQAYLERDYEKKWEGRAFRKFLRGLYDKYIIKHRIDQYEEKLFKEFDEYATQLKSFLTLEGKHESF